MNPEFRSMSFVPRSTAGCIDLAVVYFGRHPASMLKLWLAVAIPLCVVIRLLGVMIDIDLRHVVLLVYFATLPFSLALTGRIGRMVFAQTAMVDDTGSEIDRGRWKSFVSAVGMRLLLAIGPLLACFGWEGNAAWGVLGFVATTMLFPALLVRTGYHFETAEFSRYDAGSTKRMKDLLKQQFGHQFVRAIAISMFSLIVFAVILLTADTLLLLVFQTSPIVGTALEIVEDDAENALPAVFDLFVSDSGVLMLTAAVALLVFPIARVAWTFCYLDDRIRFDCWDMELRLDHEARLLRLGTP